MEGTYYKFRLKNEHLYKNITDAHFLNLINLFFIPDVK